MRQLFSYLALAVISQSLWVVGCEADVYATANSSNDGNDYFEEPIPGKFRKFEPALQTSNLFIELLSRGHIEKLYEILDLTLGHNIPPGDLENLRQRLLLQFGPVVEYKKSQWGFSTRRESGEAVIYSIKIVIHEKSEAFYVLRFVDDGEFKQVSAFSIQPRYENERVKQAANRLIAESTQ